MPTQPRLEYLTHLATNGTSADVDTLMQLLVADFRPGSREAD